MTRPTSGAPSWCSVSRRMSMYQSASRPDESVTFPCTTARSTISCRSRSRSGSVAGAVMAPTLDTPQGRRPTRSDDGPAQPLAGPRSHAGGLEHLVDDVDGGVGGLHVAADHRGLHADDGAVHGEGEVLTGALDGDLVVVQQGVRPGDRKSTRLNSSHA